MKKRQNVRVARLVAILLCVVTVAVLAFSSFAVGVGAVQAGMPFSADALYKMNKSLSSLPYTIEASIYFPEGTDFSQRQGVIVGNYGSGSCINFEITNNGQPRLYVTGSDNTVSDYIFGNAKISTTGEWIHIAVTVDKTADQVNLYIDGQLKETKVFDEKNPGNFANPFSVGGDSRGGNAQYFKGQIRSVALYGDARSAQEISADATATTVDTSDTNLLAAYTLGSESKMRIEDLSANDVDLERQLEWILPSEMPQLPDYAYSMAVIGDTQILARDHEETFTKVYDWLVENAEEQKLGLVLGLGDITDLDTEREWQLAKEQISRLNGVAPYVLTRGNHDTSMKFNTYFAGNNEYYSSLSGVYKEGKVDNSYKVLKIGKVPYVVINLDFGASDDVLEWAGKICQAYKSHNVIIITHAYLYRDGTTLDKNDTVPPTSCGGYNNGDDMWEKLVSKHENITLVLSGHDPVNNIIRTQTAGENGNIVTQMLIDPQGMDANTGANPNGLGMIAMLYFSEDGSEVTVTYYSVAKEMYYRNINQFSLEIDTTTPFGDADGNGTVGIEDAVRIAQYIAGWNVELEETAADADGNGTVGIEDAVRIAQYIAGWDVDLGPEFIDPNPDNGDIEIEEDDLYNKMAKAS